MAVVPRYQQIADDLRQRIESREFTADVPLPTEKDLEEAYGAARNTVREAVKLLVQQHLLETRAGQGTFITTAVVPFFTKLSTDPTEGLGTGGEEGATRPQGREGIATTPEVKVLRCPPDIADLLKIDETQRVVSRYQERVVDGTNWSSQTSYYPLKWVQYGAAGLLEDEDIAGGAVQYLADSIGLKQVGYRDTLLARLPDAKEQDLFNITHTHTVIEVCRTSFAEDATPIRVTVTAFPSDRNKLAYEAGKVPELEEPQGEGEHQARASNQKALSRPRFRPL